MPPKADWLPSRPSFGPLLQGMAQTERRALAFRDAGELGGWLAKHHQSSSELWVQIFKAGSGRPSVTWTDCVAEAIRFGWIDGQKLPLDEKSYLQPLTPRKPKSNWSAKNRKDAIRLIAEGRMAPAGLAHVEAAKADGRWESAYAGSATMIMPQDFLDALEAMPAAKAVPDAGPAEPLPDLLSASHGQTPWRPVPRDWPRSWRNWI